MTKNNVYLASKPRYEILDGLRGVAALVVVAFHLFETYSAGPKEQILNHGYLAVDFFFILSGFVIGYAYDDRWDRMTTWGFFKRRITRLHPLVIMGTLIGAVWFFFGDAPGFELVRETGIGKYLLCILLGCLMIPTPPCMDIRGWQEINSFNGAVWSLMWEYIANILYALFIRHFSKTLLAIFVAFSALLTIDFGLNLNLVGHFITVNDMPVDYNKYSTFIGGFGLQPDQLYIGMVRLLYPFFMGLLLSRIMRDRGTAPWKHGFLISTLIMVVVLCFPRIGGDAHWVNGLYEVIVILAVFPAVVYIGAKSQVTGKRANSICKLLGDISYPLYITHYPLIYVQMAWKANHADVPLGQHITVAICLYIFAIATAWAALKLYDEPVREWLKKHWLQR